MPDYDLGTARGKVVVDYKDRGSKAAAGAMSYLGSVAHRLTGQIKSLNDQAKDSRAGFLHIQSGAHGAEVAVKSLAGALSLLDDAMTIVDQKAIGFGKVLGHHLLDSRRIAGDLSVALRGVPKSLSWLPREVKQMIRFTGAIGTAVFGVNLLTKRTDLLARTLSVGGRLAGVSTAVTTAAAGFTSVGTAIETLRGKNVIFDKLAGAVGGFGSSAYKASDRISSMVLGLSSLAAFADSLVKLERLERTFSKFFGMGLTALGTSAALLQPALSGTSTALLGTWDAAKQLTGILALLPGSIFALGVPLIAGITGFLGLGDAMALATAQGDDAEEKFEEALAKLPPQAADAARAVREIAPAWKEVQQTVQGALFEGAGDGLRKLSENYLPVAEEGLSKVASGINDVSSGFAEFANQPRTVERIGEGMEHVAGMLSNVGDAFTPFLEGMREMGIIGTAKLLEYSSGLELAAQRFSDFAQSAAGGEVINDWIDNSIIGFRDLGRGLKGFTDAFGNILRPFAGGDFDNALDGFARMMQRFDDFTSSSGKGGQAIQQFADGLKEMSGPWMKTWGTIFDNIVDGIARLGPTIQATSKNMAKGLEIFAKVLGPIFEGLMMLLSKLSPALVATALGFASLRMQLRAMKMLSKLLSPLWALLTGLQAISRATGGATGGLRILANSFDKTAAKARKAANGGGIFERAMTRASNRVTLFANALENSSKKTAGAVGGMGRAVKSLGFLSVAGKGATAQIKGFTGAIAESVTYARKASPQLSGLGALGKVVGANLAAAGKSMKNVGQQFKASGKQIKDAGVEFIHHKDAADKAAEAAKKAAEASKPPVVQQSRIRSAYEGFADRVESANERLNASVARVNAGFRSMASAPGNAMRSVGSAAVSMGQSMGRAASYATQLPGAFAQSMKYAKQAAPEMSTLGRASRVLGINFTEASKGAQAFNRSAATLGTAVSGGVTGALTGARGAASGLLGVMGGPWGAVFMAATAVGADFVMQSQRVAQANKSIATAGQEAVRAQKDLQIALALNGGKRSDETVAEGQKMVQAELDRTAASAEKSTGLLQGFAKFGNNVLGMSYEDMAKKADKASLAFDRNGWEGQMAAKRQQALDNALKATGMTMAEAVSAFESGGPPLDRLKAALNDTGGAGRAVIADMSGVRETIQGTADSVENMGPRAAALAAALSIVTDAAASAEDKLNALRIALQAMGLMDDSNFDSAQAVADSIHKIADSASSVSTEVDAMGNSFLTAENELNRLHKGAGQVQDDLQDLRETILQADPGEAMALFEAALPALEMMRRELNLSEPVWQSILKQMGLVPESIETQVRFQNMEPTEAALFAINEQVKALNGQKAVDLEVSALTEDAKRQLEALGYTVEWIDEKTGTAKITADSDEASAELDAFVVKMASINELRAEGKLDVDTYGVTMGVGQTAAAIASVNGFFGEGLVDVDTDSVPPKVGFTQDLIEGFSAYGEGFIGADNSSVFAATAAAEAEINRVNGLTAFVNIIGNLKMPALPAGAGTLSAFGATGGKFKGDRFDRLPAYAKGARHKGYRLPNQGPGTSIVDGFLALNALGTPVARLDQDEWVINGKSSKKWNRLLAAINRDDPRLKSLPGFAEGRGLNAQSAQVARSVSTVSAQLDLVVNPAEIERVSAYLAQISSDEFAEKFSKGLGDGLMLGSRDHFKEQAKQYADALGIEFGKAAREANERLEREIEDIEDKNLKEQKRKLIIQSDELQRIADREMEEWIKNNQFEAMGFQMAKSFTDGVSSGQNLLQAGIGALAQTAAMALSAAGAPGIVAGIAVTAIGGLFSALSDPKLWDDGMGAGIYKIVDSALAGLPTMLLDIGNNITKIFGLDLSKVPIIGGLFDIKDAANGTSKAIDKLMTDLEALEKLEYKSLGKTGATTIDDAIASQLGNRVSSHVTEPAASPAPSGPAIGVLNVSAPDDKASSIIETATFAMKRF